MTSAPERTSAMPFSDETRHSDILTESEAPAEQSHGGNAASQTSPPAAQSDAVHSEAAHSEAAGASAAEHSGSAQPQAAQPEASAENNPEASSHTNTEASSLNNK